MKKIFSIFVALLGISSAFAQDLTYNVTVPAGTKACYIAGGMTDWSFTEMTKVDDTHYTITAGPGEYKYCSGPNWNYVEKDAQGGEISNRTYSESDVVASWNAVYDPETPTPPTPPSPEENVYGIAVNGTPVLGIKNEIPQDPSFEEWFVLNQSLETGDLVTLYNQNGGTTWVVTLDEASVEGIELNATGDAYIITQDGCYDFYMKLKFGADQLYVGSCAAPVEYKYTEYENWQIKYGNTWVWSDNMEKVEDGLFKLEILWEGTGFNVKSDENPIKKDWFAPEELAIGEEVLAPVTVDVYLKVIDDETIKIGIGVEPTTALPTLPYEGKVGKEAAKFLHNGQLIIRKGNKHFNALGAEVK